ncbi:MAG: ABC transporter permease [bacterium]
MDCPSSCTSIFGVGSGSLPAGHLYNTKWARIRAAEYTQFSRPSTGPICLDLTGSGRYVEADTEREHRILHAINKWLKSLAAETQGIFFFSLKMVGAVFSRRLYFSETIEQMYQIGVGSLYLVVLTGVFAGQGFALAFSNELMEFGAKNYLGRIMSIAIIRELGPTLTGLMFAARVAAGITAEIGAMKSSNQLDAMVAFGIDPIRKIAVPRLLALIVMLPALTIVCDAIAIVGGWVIAIFISHVSSTLYWASVKERLIFGNIFIGILKPFVFSFVIAFISCYRGFTSGGGTRGVGRATTSSVVASSITILIVNFFITKVIWSFLRGWL